MLPDVLEIPEGLASTLILDPALTARDRAVMFAVSWFAARNPPAEGEAAVMVPDLPLRRALGDMRRDDAVKEAARYRRLEEAIVRGDETLPDLHEGVLVPTVQPSMRRRTIAGQREWLVEPGIVTSFTVYAGDPVVGVPCEVLARARSRYTLQLMLRVLSWSSGGYDPKWLRREAPDRTVLRIPLDAFKRDLGIVDRVSPTEMMRSEIQPAIDEIQRLTDSVVDVAPVRAPSLKKGGGRVIAIDVLLGRTMRVVSTTGIALPAPSPPAQVVPLRKPGFDAFRPIPALRKLGPASSSAPSHGDDSPF